VTGAAGFIGSHVARRLAALEQPVVGIDNLNDYYDPALKRARLEDLATLAQFTFEQVDCTHGEPLADVFRRYEPVKVIHLAAQAGVRHSLSHPMDYIDANVVGFMRILEECRRAGVDHLVYASSSSVYGHTAQLPFSVHTPADHPVSIYAATKRANELMAHAFSHLHGLPATGLRFFTVYGPWGRPDMAYYKFARAIILGETLSIYGDGSALRDFTYVDDIVEGLVRVAADPAVADPEWDRQSPDPARSRAPWRLFNIGHGEQVTVNAMIDLLEDIIGRPARRLHVAAEPGDVPVTHADTEDLQREFGFTPTTGLRDGLERFVHWMRTHAIGQ
jgi:UDP-glucuronate 4-epimerase